MICYLLVSFSCVCTGVLVGLGAFEFLPAAAAAIVAGVVAGIMVMAAQKWRDDAITSAVKSEKDLYEAFKRFDDLCTQNANRAREKAEIQAQELMEALKKADSACLYCKHAHDGEAAIRCKATQSECDICPVPCACYTCEKNSNWEWKGETTDDA